SKQVAGYPAGRLTDAANLYVSRYFYFTHTPSPEIYTLSLHDALPILMTVGWFLPPLFAAAHTERLPRKLPFVLKWTGWERVPFLDRKSTRLNSSHLVISYAVFCLKKKKVSHLTEQIFLSVNDRRVPER